MYDEGIACNRTGVQRNLYGCARVVKTAPPAGRAPAMENTLSSVEGQRVMQVLDETLNATRLISCVTSDLRSRSRTWRTWSGRR